MDKFVDNIMLFILVSIALMAWLILLVVGYKVLIEVI